LRPRLKLLVLTASCMLLCAGELSLKALAQDSKQIDQPELRGISLELDKFANLNGSQKGLTFQKLLEMVNRNYPKLLSADAERRIAGAKRREKAGSFDPVLNHISEFLRLQDTFEAGKAKDAIHNESRLELLTRSGVKVFVGARLNPNDTKTPFLPTGKSGEYSGGISVPLFRGFRINEKTAAEQQAKLGEPLAAQIFGANRLEVLFKAAATYWEWVGSKARYDVSRNLLKIAVDRVDQIRERVNAGDAPALDITESEQEIHRREASLVRSDREFQKASIALSLFLWTESGPLNVPALTEVPRLDFAPKPITESEQADAKRVALSLRPELKRINYEREQAKVELRLAENLLLPLTDVFAAQGADTGPQGIGPVVRGGFNFSWPITGQRTARGQIEAAKLKIQKLTLDEKFERQRIEMEVADVASAINTTCDKYNAAVLEVKKAKEVEQGERLRFGVGDSTVFLVNQRERFSAEAELRMVETHVEYLQAISALKAVTCKL
jgi:outer membrane protein